MFHNTQQEDVTERIEQSSSGVGSASIDASPTAPPLAPVRDGRLPRPAAPTQRPHTRQHCARLAGMDLPPLGVVCHGALTEVGLLRLRLRRRSNKIRFGKPQQILLVRFPPRRRAGCCDIIRRFV